MKSQDCWSRACSNICTYFKGGRNMHVAPGAGKRESWLSAACDPDRQGHGPPCPSVSGRGLLSACFPSPRRAQGRGKLPDGLRGPGTA